MGHLLAAEQATTLPDAIIALGGFALLAFVLWLCLR